MLCTGNSCRSQIADGYLRALSPQGINVYSAGVETHGVNPKAIETMKEDGIDISSHTSNNVNEYGDIEFDYIITVCDNAKERCPYFPSKAYRFHQNFPDPAKAVEEAAKAADKESTDDSTKDALINEKINTEFAKVRDMVKIYCKEFISAYL